MHGSESLQGSVCLVLLLLAQRENRDYLRVEVPLGRFKIVPKDFHHRMLPRPSLRGTLSIRHLCFGAAQLIPTPTALPAQPSWQPPKLVLLWAPNGGEGNLTTSSSAACTRESRTPQGQRRQTQKRRSVGLLIVLHFAQNRNCQSVNLGFVIDSNQIVVGVHMFLVFLAVSRKVF